MKKIIFIGNGRDFHAMDWYKNAQIVCYPNKVLFATDLIESEGHARLADDSINIIELYNIDKFLLKKQSKFGDIWRNIVKLLFSPVQIICIKNLAKHNPDAIFHAHTMYYMYLAWLAKIDFIGTPQGSEILVRPFKSQFYKYFASKALQAAKHVTVDSINMQQKTYELSGVKAHIIQNGIAVSEITTFLSSHIYRDKIISIRGFTPLYRIKEILDARNYLESEYPISMTYPFWDIEYKNIISEKFIAQDSDLGKLPLKEDLYKLFSAAFLAISIPVSDSSPRSVYEAIFCGCCVAVTYNKWIDILPNCMKSRVLIVDINDKFWLKKAIEESLEITKNIYIPSESALELFDQKKSMEKLAKLCYS